MEFSSSRLKQIREILGINKAEAARRLHITAMAYGRYEKGERMPSYQTVRYMAQILGTSADYLFGLTDDPAPVEIVISSETDPELFEVVCSLKPMNSDARKRLLAYSLKLLSQSGPESGSDPSASTE